MLSSTLQGIILIPKGLILHEITRYRYLQVQFHCELDMPIHWYVLRSKPRKEWPLWQYAKSRGVECFFPRIQVNPVNPRARKVKPYFPGYMFVKADLEEIGYSIFQWMPHSLGLVEFDGDPAPVPDGLVQGIHRTVKKISEVGGKKFEGLQPGDEVFVESGPFSGYKAIFDAQASGRDRVRVLLKMLNEQRNIPIELEIGHIRKDS